MNIFYIACLLTYIYGCEIWGFKEDMDLEKVEIKFLKSILHLPDSTPTMAVRSELGPVAYLLIVERKNFKVLE